MSRPLASILIADPHAVVRLGVKAFIQPHDYYHVVGEAKDGDEALRRAAKTSPTVAIIGWVLPGLNGPELFRRIKDASPRTEILIYTYVNCEMAILDALKAGAKGYVLKSDSHDQLIEAIDSLCLGRRYFSRGVSRVLLKRLQSTRASTETCLTYRERDIAKLVAGGRNNREISDQLNITRKTVESHRLSIMHKIDSHRAADLVRFAIRNNIIQP